MSKQEDDLNAAVAKLSNALRDLSVRLAVPPAPPVVDPAVAEQVTEAINTMADLANSLAPPPPAAS